MIPTLPDTLLTYSTAFSWKTSLFDLYHKLIDTEPFAMDLMDYAHLSTPTYNITSEQALLDLCHSINGRQLNLLEAEGDRRYKESVNSFREVTGTARNDLQHMLESWCHVEGHAWPAKDTAAVLIHGLSLEWGARAIVGLSMELQVWREGLVKYQLEYQGRKLWWQNIKAY